MLITIWPRIGIEFTWWGCYFMYLDQSGTKWSCEHSFSHSQGQLCSSSELNSMQLLIRSKWCHNHLDISSQLYLGSWMSISLIDKCFGRKSSSMPKMWTYQGNQRSRNGLDYQGLQVIIQIELKLLSWLLWNKRAYVFAHIWIRHSRIYWWPCSQ